MKNLCVRVSLVAAAAFLWTLLDAGAPAEWSQSTISSFCGVNQAQAAPPSTGDRVGLRIYVMSRCPFAKQVIASLDKVLARIGSDIDFSVDYIGTMDGDKPTSMHGPTEVEGDILWLCAAKHWPKANAYVKLMACMANDMPKIPGNFETCADQVKMPKPLQTQVKACAQGGDGEALLKASFERSLKAGARGSPTISIGGTHYTGGRTEEAFMRALCNSMNSLGTPPAECATLAPVVVVETLLITDKRCTDKSCDTTRIEAQLPGMLPGVRIVRRLDWSDPEAKEILKEEGVQYLPALLLAESVERSEGYETTKRFLKATTTGRYRTLNIGSKHDPNMEICDNLVDDTQDGLVDCQDPTCKQGIICRTEVPGQLELFIMAQCPFAAKAIAALQEVLVEFGPELDVVVHYVGNDSSGTPTSLHGPAEVTADILCMCASRFVPDDLRYIDFLTCMTRDFRNFAQGWPRCAEEAHLSDEARTAIDACTASAQAPKELLEDFRIAQSMGITGSPTWVINGRHRFMGVVPKIIQTSICEQNPGMKGCKAALRSK